MSYRAREKLVTGKPVSKVFDLCFRYRWVLAILVFVGCLCFRIHGSSIGVYNAYFPTKLVEEESTLLGQPRPIRSDEYGVASMKFFPSSITGFTCTVGR